MERSTGKTGLMKHASFSASLLVILATTDLALPAQDDWQLLTSIHPTPPGRYLFGFAYDSHHQHALLFGGQLFGGFYANDTWQFDGANWVQLTPSNSPPGISTNMMAYDSARQRMVLFGGVNNSGFSNQTWEWTGSTWLQRFPATSPPARGNGACAYDTVRRRTVVFGGWNGTRMSDTWEYDGTTWVQTALLSHPAGRSDNTMAYDEGRATIVMHGGYDDSFAGFLGDTWEYNGAWSQASPLVSAGPVADPAIVYDRGRGRIVLFGGKQMWATQNTDQTFEYDGATWTDITSTLPAAPSGRWVAQMTYDEANGRSVMFGGADNFNLFPGDTWQLVRQNVATHRTYGNGCPGTVGQPQLILDGNQLPRLGSAWGLRLLNLPTGAGTLAMFSFGLSNTNSVLGALPFPLAPLGMPGCTMLASPDVNLFAFASGGTAGATLAVPNQAWLQGLHLFAQGGVFDAAANAGGFVLAEAGDGKVGL